MRCGERERRRKWALERGEQMADGCVAAEATAGMGEGEALRIAVRRRCGGAPRKIDGRRPICLRPSR